METELSIFRNQNLDYDRLAESDAEALINQIDLTEEIRNLDRAFYLSIGGAIPVVLSLILSAILTSHHKSSTFIWQTSWLGFTILCLAYCSVWSKRAGNALRVSREPIPIQTGITFQTSLFMALYHFVQMFWIIQYRPIHYNYLLSLRANQEEWVKKFGSESSFEDTWNREKSMMTLVTIFAAMICFTFGFIAYSARSLHSQKYFLSRMALYTSLIVISVSSWSIIYSVFETYTYEKAMPSNLTGGQNDVIFFYSAIAVILGISNAFVNHNRSKSGYMICTLISFILGISFFSSTGLLLHDVKETALNDIFSSHNCRTTMVTIHENNLGPHCPVGGKYLPPGQSCKKEDFVYRWENQHPGEIRALNPACCEVAKVFYLEPYMNLIYWGLISIFTCASCTVFNLLLMEYQGSRLWVGRVTRKMDVLSIGAILALFFGYLLYFIIRSPSTIFNGTNPEVDRYLKPFDHQLPNLRLIPESIKQAANSTVFGPKCLNWHADVYPAIDFDPKSETCKEDCVHRIAILIKRGTMRVSFSSRGKVGAENTKKVFYPGCTESDDGYLYIWGPIESLKEMITGSLICPSSKLSPILYIKQSQVPANSLDKDGLNSTDKDIVNQAGVLTSTSTACLAGFTEFANCAGECKVFFDTSKVGVPEIVKGRLYFQDLEGKEVSFKIPATVKIEAYRDGNKIESNFNLYEGGIWSLDKIIRVYNFSYVLTLNITDSSKRFLPKLVDILVPPEDVTTTELSAGNIRLLTADGKVCTAPNEPCTLPILDQPLKGSLKVALNTEANTKSTLVLIYGLNSVTVQIIKGHRVSGEVIQVTRNFDTTGKATFKDLEYGSYTIYVKKEGYADSVQFIELQENMLTFPTIILRPILEDHDMIVTAKMTDPKIDYDLHLLITNDKGFECIVSPFNKYCGYSMMQNDITSSGVGEESILVKRLALANYMAYVQPALPYAQNCKLGTEIDTSDKHYLSLEWGLIKPNPVVGPTIILDTTTYDEDYNLDASGLPISALKVLPPVESLTQANVEKKLIGRNGEDVSSENIVVSTNILQLKKNQEESKVPQNQAKDDEPEDTSLEESVEDISEQGDEPTTQKTATTEISLDSTKPEAKSDTNKEVESSPDSKLKSAEKSSTAVVKIATRAVTQEITESTFDPEQIVKDKKTEESITQSEQFEESSLSALNPDKTMSFPFDENSLTSLKDPSESEASPTIIEKSKSVSAVIVPEKLTEDLKLEPLPTEFEYPALLEVSILSDLPDTSRFTNETLDSAAYDDKLTAPDNAGDKRSTISAEPRQRTTLPDGIHSMVDSIKNLTQITTTKAYRSQYNVSLKIAENGVNKVRTVDFTGTTKENDILKATRNVTAFLNVTDGVQNNQFKDDREFNLSATEKVIVLTHHNHTTNHQADEKNSTIICIGNLTQNFDKTVCEDSQSALSPTEGKLIGTKKSQRSINKTDNTQQDLYVLVKTNTMTNGTKATVKEFGNVSFKDSKETKNYIQSEVENGPLKDDLKAINRSKTLKETFDDGSTHELDSNLEQIESKGVILSRFFNTTEKNVGSFLNRTIEEVQNSSTVGSMYTKTTSTRQDANFSEGVTAFVEIKTKFEEESKKNSILAVISTIKHFSPDKGINTNHSIENKTVEKKYLDPKLSTNNVELEIFSQLNSRTEIKKAEGNTLVRQSNQTVSEIFSSFFNKSTVNTTAKLNTSTFRDHLDKQVNSTINEDTHAECDPPKLCKVSRVLNVTEIYEIGKQVSRIETAKTADEPPSSYLTNTTSVNLTKADGKEETIDEKIVDKKEDGSITTKSKYQRNLDQNGVDIKAKTELKIELIESQEREVSPIRFKKQYQKKLSGNYSHPKQYKSEESVQEETIVMKDKTTKTLVKTQSSKSPEESVQMDKVKSESYYLITSLKEDVEKPKDLTEYLVKQQNSTIEYAAGDILKKTIDHMETSKTDKQFNQTVESHIVTREMKNGSIVVRARKVVGLKVLANNTVFAKRNYSTSVKTGDKIETTWTYTYIQVNDFHDNKLLDFQSYPPATTNLKDVVKAGHLFGRKRILQGEVKTSDLNKDIGKFILVSCFNGFGKASLVQVNQIVKSVPKIRDCISQINEKRSYFTYDLLKKAYDDKIAS
jgi:hypothetical protein